MPMELVLVLDSSLVLLVSLPVPTIPSPPPQPNSVLVTKIMKCKTMFVSVLESYSMDNVFLHPP